MIVNKKRALIKAEMFENAKAEYNLIFKKLGLDCLTVDSESSSYKNTRYWNLRDLVSEAKYQYSVFLDRLKSTDFDYLKLADRTERLNLINSCRILKDFIDKYKFNITNINSYDEHFSKFDKICV